MYHIFNINNQKLFQIFSVVVKYEIYHLNHFISA